jgi:cytochrome c556
MRSTILAAALVAAPIFAQDGSAPPKDQRMVRMAPQQIVEARRAAFRLSAADFQLVRTAAEKGADLRSLAGAARSLSQWAAILPALFPAGTGPDVVETRAKAEIWSNRADFERRARDYTEAAARMAEAAAAGDMTRGGAAWDVTRETCNACHELYRSDPPAPQ